MSANDGVFQVPEITFLGDLLKGRVSAWSNLPLNQGSCDELDCQEMEPEEVAIKFAKHLQNAKPNLAGGAAQSIQSINVAAVVAVVVAAAVAGLAAAAVAGLAGPAATHHMNKLHEKHETALFSSFSFF